MPTLFKNGKNYSGTSVSLTQAEYNALSESAKMNGTVYFITDSNATMDASDISLGSGTVEDLAGSLAMIEVSPATANHAVGDFIVYNGQLYKVTTAISTGNTLTGKITAVTVGSEINDIYSLLNGDWIKLELDSTYLSVGTVAYKKIGKLVLVRCMDLVIASTISANVVTRLSTGLPPAEGTVAFMLTRYDNGSSFRAGISTSGNFNAHYPATAISASAYQYYGFAMYNTTN